MSVFVSLTKKTRGQNTREVTFNAIGQYIQRTVQREKDADHQAGDDGKLKRKRTAPERNVPRKKAALMTKARTQPPDQHPTREQEESGNHHGFACGFHGRKLAGNRVVSNPGTLRVY